MEEHATKLRRRTRNVRKKLAQVAVLEKKEAAGEELTMEQLRKMQSKPQFEDEERALVAEASELKIELAPSQPPDEPLPENALSPGRKKASDGASDETTPVKEPAKEPAKDADNEASGSASADEAPPAPRTALFMLQQSRQATSDKGPQPGAAEGSGGGKKSKKKKGKQVLWSSGSDAVEEQQLQAALRASMGSSAEPKVAWGSGPSPAPQPTAKEPLTMAALATKSAPTKNGAAAGFAAIQNAQQRGPGPRPRPAAAPSATAARPPAGAAWATPTKSSPPQSKNNGEGSPLINPHGTVSLMDLALKKSKSSPTTTPVKGWGKSPSPKQQAAKQSSPVGGPKLTLESLESKAKAKREQSCSQPSLLDIQNEQVSTRTGGGGGTNLGWAAVTRSAQSFDGNTSRWNHRDVLDQTDAEKATLATIQKEAESKKESGKDSGLFWDDDEDEEQDGKEDGQKKGKGQAKGNGTNGHNKGRTRAKSAGGRGGGRGGGRAAGGGGRGGAGRGGGSKGRSKPKKKGGARGAAPAAKPQAAAKPQPTQLSAAAAEWKPGA